MAESAVNVELLVSRVPSSSAIVKVCVDTICLTSQDRHRRSCGAYQEALATFGTEALRPVLELDGAVMRYTASATRPLQDQENDGAARATPSLALRSFTGSFYSVSINIHYDDASSPDPRHE